MNKIIAHFFVLIFAVTILIFIYKIKTVTINLPSAEEQYIYKSSLDEMLGIPKSIDHKINEIFDDQLIEYINKNQKKLSEKQLKILLSYCIKHQVNYTQISSNRQMSIELNSKNKIPEFEIQKDSLYELTFSSNGYLIYYKNDNLKNEILDSGHIDSTIHKIFQYNHKDIHQFQLTINADNNKIHYLYTNKDFISDIEEQYSFHFFNNQLNVFKNSFQFLSQKSFLYFDTSNISNINSIIVLFIFIIIFAYHLIKKSNQGILNYKTNMGFAFIFTLLFLTNFISLTHFDIKEFLVTVLIGSLFMIIIFIITLAITDYLARQIGNSKMIGIDSIRNKSFLNSLISANLSDSLKYSAYLILIYSLFLIIAYSFHFISYNSWENFTEFYYNRFSLLKIFLDSFWNTVWILIIGQIALLYSIKKLKLKEIYKKTIFILFWGFLFTYSGFITLTHFSYILQIPFALFTGYMFYSIINKNDFLTVFFAAFTAQITILSLNYYFLVPENQIILFLLAIFIGIITTCSLLGKKRDISDNELSYFTPGYIHDLLEKERFKNQLEAARTIQKNFLPKEIPDISYIDIATYCKPALEVGGDYYDIFSIGENKTAFAIGDVSGKGISAAFYMTLTKGFIRAVSSYESSPHQTLVKTNELFYENVDRGHFISMIFGIYDNCSKQFTFSRAGHNCPLLYTHKDRAAEWLNPSGIAIGLDSGVIFKETLKELQLNLRQGDILFLYTDGLTEASNYRNVELSENKVKSFVEESAHLSAKEILKHIIKKTEHFVGNEPQHDDMTMILIKIKEQE